MRALSRLHVLRFRISRSFSLVHNFTNSLASYLESRNGPVIRLASPKEIENKFSDIKVPLSLEDGISHPDADLEAATSLLLQLSARTNHPLFFNQLYGRADPVGVAAEWVSSATNTNCHTFEVAPVYTLMENEVLSKVASCIGGVYERAHDGLFVPGGSIAVLYAMHLAAHRSDPKRVSRGAAGGPVLVAFVSKDAHYSYLKSAKLLGIGEDNLIRVPTDSLGRMDISHLDSLISKTKAEGRTPFFIGSTAGTTVRGSFDSFEDIAQVCSKHPELWHHVDASWGGSAMLSPKHRWLMKGADKGDSLCWNPHKMVGAPLQCSIFLTQHIGALAAVNSTNASYLFQPDKLHAQADRGDKTIQCGRKTDAFKLWLMWKARGDGGMAAVVDKCFALAHFFAQRMRETEGFQIVYEPACTNVCFWYVPARLRPFNFDTASEQTKQSLNRVAPSIKTRMQETGDALIGFQAMEGRPNFFRIVFAGARDTPDAEMRHLLDEMILRIAALGEQAPP